jgi:hypothetical protein
MMEVVTWAESRWPGFSSALNEIQKGPRGSSIDHILNEDLEGVFELFIKIQETLDKQKGLSLRDIVILDQLGINLFDE